VVDDIDATCRLKPGDNGTPDCQNITKQEDEATSGFTDNGWWTLFNTGAGDQHDDRARLSPSSPRWYRLEITLSDGCGSPPAAGNGGSNGFKVRTTGQIRTADAMTVIGRDAAGPFAAATTVPATDNKFDGTLDVRFFVGNGTERFFVEGAPEPSGVTLSQADADDSDLGGIADGATPSIFFSLFAGEPDGTEWLQDWFALVRAGTAAGKRFRRARIVSEPVTEYQRWVLQDSHLYVDAGEDIRWTPRDRVSAIALPGNDFWLFDDSIVVFLIFAGTGLVVDRHSTTDPDTIQLCRSAFEAVWKLSIPNSDYQSR